MTQTNADVAAIRARFAETDAAIAVIGLGYVGLPLLAAIIHAGFHGIGFDVDSSKTDALMAGQSYIKSIPDELVAKMAASGRLEASSDPAILRQADAILICVPTPLGNHRDPDLSFVKATAETLTQVMQPGQLIVLESTTYPGTTSDVVKPILERGGLVCEKDFFLAYSPEREDPANPNYTTSSIPKVVAGIGPRSMELADALYKKLASETVPVSSTATAEAVKLTENIFRSVNIALVNELKLVYQKMGIDIWEVIDAAKTKPFGFMPFYPGPGLGGHCIPIDPFYLTWKAREYGIATRFIELAGEINTRAPHHVIAALSDALNDRKAKSLNGARILLVGLAYKKNVDDIRESPALVLLEEMEKRGAEVTFYDPFVPIIPVTREHASLAGRQSISWTTENLSGYDAALIATDHDEVDYGELLRCIDLVIDTRNATADLQENRDHIVKA